MKKTLYAVLIFGLASSLLGVLGVTAATPSVDPIFVPGNPTCEELGFEYGVRVDNAMAGNTYIVPVDGELITGTVSADGIYLDWQSTLGIDAVLVKGGPAANLYQYDPPAESFGDTGLHSPQNPPEYVDHFPEISHFDFCYDFEVTTGLVVDKSAETSFTRLYEWSIEKTAAMSDLTLSPGQEYIMNYTVTLSTTNFSDSDWAVRGDVWVINYDPALPAMVTETVDLLSGFADSTPLTCNVTFPYELAPSSSYVCTYGPVALPDGSERINTAWVTYTYGVSPEVAMDDAPVLFELPTDEVDECVQVADDLYGDLGQVCACNHALTLPYTLTIGPYESCGVFTVINTAVFTASDSGATGSASWVLNVEVPCEAGCTRTFGYWKTHSHHGPAPEDPGWYELGDVDADGISEGADEMYFLSGQTYYQVMRTPPKHGNAYYILAHQYVAAKLNILNGATSTPEVDAAILWSEAFFGIYTPADSLPKPLRQLAIATAELLDQYNNGEIGPGHCDEDLHSTPYEDPMSFYWGNGSQNFAVFLPISQK
jgi:hypothetical protein